MTKEKKILTVIVPCYNEQDTINIFYKEINKVSKIMNYIDFEFLFINDGSKDNTLNILRKLSKKDERLNYISFSRNFGKESAMYAGLENSTGDYITIMDADLQDPPSLLPEMYKCIVDEGYDCVATRRATRNGEPILRSFFARMYYKIINSISNTKMVEGARDYRLMTRDYVNSILSMKEYNRFTKGLFSWIGYKTKWIEYENIERVAGKTKWSFFGLFKYALESIISFSTFPLLLPFILSIISFLYSFIILILATIGINPSLIIKISAIIMFSLSIILSCLGILGLYISKLYTEIKNRPKYIVKETN
ncbi:MAG: glycosyltransferase family 2 protein [bacterium]|nr:glycosyltransferase family 2 protein [bacterium]